MCYNILETASAETLAEITNLTTKQLVAIFDILAKQVQRRYDLENHPIVNTLKNAGDTAPVTTLTWDILTLLWERLNGKSP